MSRDELSLFSYEILGLVGGQGLGAHDLLRMARESRIMAWAGESQYYVEPKRLAKLGYLEARKEPGKTRERTVYSLTDQGLEALREYAATAGRVPGGEERSAPAAPDRRPGRRGGHAHEHGHPARGRDRPAGADQGDGGARRDAARTGASTC